MSGYYKIQTTEFADYLQSAVKLDALEKITRDLDQELEDSKRIMSEIKAMYQSIPTLQTNQLKSANTLRHEDISTFLEADVPKLLLPDMVENTLDVDVDNVIATMRKYAEELKKNLVAAEVREKPKKLDDLELEQYAVSLDQLSKRLANIKLNNRDVSHKNPELETKLSLLCEDVNMFTNMVQAKTTLSECNKSWLESRRDTNALQYDSIINKLLAGINEVTYLLQNKN